MAMFTVVCVQDTLPVGSLYNAGDCDQGAPVWVDVADIDTGVWQELTITDAGLLSTAIVLVWIAGWGARQVIRVIRR